MKLLHLSVLCFSFFLVGCGPNPPAGTVGDANDPETTTDAEIDEELEEGLAETAE